LADPKDYPNLFPDFQAALQAQDMLKKERSNVIPAADYLEILPNHERKPLQELDQGGEEDLEEDDFLDEKDHPVTGSGKGAESVGDDLEAELEADLENMKLDDIDTSDVNLDDEGLLED